MMKKMGRGVGHMFDQLLMRGIITVLVVGGLLIVGTTLADTYEDTSFVKVTQCTFFGTTRADCPAYGAALTSAREAADAARADATHIQILAEEDRRKAARMLAEAEGKAKALDDQLSDIEAISNGNNSFTLFARYNDGPGDWRITVATDYASLVPADPNPDYGCYFNLAEGDAGESRNWWFKNTGSGTKDDRRMRRQHGISDAAWEYAKSVCNPTLIGDDGG